VPNLDLVGLALREPDAEQAKKVSVSRLYGHGCLDERLKSRTTVVDVRLFEW